MDVILRGDFVSRALGGSKHLLLVFISVSNLIVRSQAFSQRSTCSFSQCTDVTLQGAPRALAIGARGGYPNADVAVLAGDRASVEVFTVKENGQLTHAFSFALHAPQQEIIPSDGIDAETEFITLSVDGSSVSLLKRHGPSFVENVIPVEGQPRHVVVADINNDGRKDLLLFGKSAAGVSTLLGRKGGMFVAGPVLFPEISVSDLRTADLNGDGITDVLLLNWLSNQLAVFYGISRTVFSEQLTVDLHGEPARLAVGPVTKRRTFRVAVTIPSRDRIEVFTGNSAGEFENNGAVTCPGAPEGIALVDINGDQLPDIVSSTAKGAMVCLAESQADFEAPVTFGVGTGPWAVADIDGDGKPDLVVTNPATQRLVAVVNAGHSPRTSWPDVYAVGTEPRGIAIAAFNQNGYNDIAVANRGSSSVSMLRNTGNGKFSGQQSMSVPDGPRFITVAYRSPGRSGAIVTSHPGADRIGVIEVADDFARSESFSIPTSSDPYVLQAGEDSTSHRLDILVRYRNRGEASVTLSLFEQLTGRQFLERSLRTNLPNRITALSVDDFRGTNTEDLVFVTNDSKTRLSTTSIAQGGEGFGFSSPVNLFTYPDSLSVTRTILPGYLGGGRFRDLMLILGPPRNAIAVACGRGDGTFSDSLQWIQDVQPKLEDAVIVRDVDGDGINDIVILDGLRDAVIELQGTGGGTFAPPRVVCPAPGVTGIAVAPLRTRGVQDLILSHGDAGTISLLFGPFRRHAE